MKKRVTKLIHTLLVCLIIPSTLLLQKYNPYINYDFSYQSIFNLLLTIALPIFLIWTVWELWQIIRRR
ncbi:hypothetical protein [Enterococcus gilvus]|uniref:hypothetical protein n=1 Tax=Enterococcus gilvus TaxID=160453 RepID=UPI0029104013|nr:hypothetical protein [Enterococcus gilvus]MDU5510992.1 hypothetical protein [Enterococcus gilvus]